MWLAGALASGCSAQVAVDDNSTPSGQQGGHDFVEVQLLRAADQTSSPFAGTVRAQIRMQYGDCFQQFYAAHPNWASDGVDGAATFGSWTGRLCDADVDELADCEVAGIVQRLNDSAQDLTVTYDIDGALEGQSLLFGPLPVADLAACPGGFSPRVRLELDGTGGEDVNGDPLWSISSHEFSEFAPGYTVGMRASPL